MVLLYNNENERRKKEIQDLYRRNMQMQQYNQNKENMWQKGSNTLGYAQNGMNAYNTFKGNGSGNGFSFGGNANNVGGYIQAAKGGMDVGNDLQRKDYTNAGLDTAKTVSSFFGPWGQAAAAAIQMYQGYRNRKQKKAQEAGQKGMEELMKAEQSSEDKKAQVKQNLEQQNAENEAEVEQMSSQPQTSDEIKREIYNQTANYPYNQNPYANTVYNNNDNNNQYLNNITGVQDQQVDNQNTTSSSPITQEILQQVQGNGQNYSSPYSIREIEQELRRRGAL